MSEFTIKYEAKMPPTRKFDREQAEWRGVEFKTRAEELAEKLAEPGRWASDVKLNGKTVSWTVTYPDGFDLSPVGAAYEMMEFVGYVGSDTIGPKSRKATLRYAIDGGEFSTEHVCRGAF